MSGTTKPEPAKSATDSFKDAVAAMSNAGKTSIHLYETYALEVQKQWFSAAEAYVNFWSQLSRSALDLAAGASVLQAENAQQAVDRLKHAADGA
jgi:hypothetical protein